MGKEASCALISKRRWIRSESFRNLYKTRTKKGKPLLPREGQGPMEKPLERRGCFPGGLMVV